MPIQSETELYEPVKRIFETMGYVVKSEVKHCDLVALRGEEEPVLVELKRTFNLPLLVQGIDRLRQSPRVYVAVEQSRTGRAPHGLRWSELQRLCRMLGLGLIVVRFYKRKAPAVEILCDPAPYKPPKNVRKTQRLLHEFKERSGDYNVGGSSKRKLVTSYREKALHCAYFLQQQGPQPTRRLRELTGNSKVTMMLQDNHYLWFRRVSRGVYELTEQGEQALTVYDDVLRQVLAARGTLPLSENSVIASDVLAEMAAGVENTIHE